MNVLEKIYPSSSSDGFIDNISDRFEFNIPVIKDKNSCENNDFKLTAYQIFLKNYISNTTPYNSILIYHGTGTGKTCSAISIAENFRDVYHRKDKRIIILSSGNIKQGWYNNIYNPKRDIDQCTEDTYKYLGKDLGNDNAKRDKLVKKYYELYGYLTFANRIKEIYEDDCRILYDKNKYITIPINKLTLIKETKETKETKDIVIGSAVKWKDNIKENIGKVVDIINKSKDFKKNINRIYSDRVLIIDEAHNIRGDDKNKSDDSIKYIKLMVENVKNLKLILLSATPMYNKADEISELLSLLYSNDKRSDIVLKDIFKGDILVDPETLRKGVVGYISYINAGDTDKFPEKLYPLENTIKYNEASNMPLYECKMNKYQKDKYISIYEQVKDADQLTRDGILRQCSNIIYPNNTNKIEKYYGKRGLDKFLNYNTSTKKYKYKENVEKIFLKKNIVKYSTKISMLLENIEKSEGIVFVYSQYIQSGIIPIMLALEENGYNNYSENILDTKNKKNGYNYIAITADPDLSKNKVDEIEISRSYDNRNGSKIKIILGSKVATEGLDLKNIRSIHVFDPWYNLKRLEQIIGRGIRYCSHKDLNDEMKNNTKNNTTIYMYASTLEDKEKSIDLEIYNLAEQKNNEILKVETILQENAVDVELFKDINKPSKIDIKCKRTINKNSNSLNKNSLENMYNVYKIYIKDIFKETISCNIETIIKKICSGTEARYMNYKLLYLTLKDMINKKYILEYKNSKGYLVYINKNYIFQPLDKLDNYISIYDREKNKRILKDKYINLTIKKQNIDKNTNIPEIDVKYILDQTNKSYSDIFNTIIGFDDTIKYHMSIERLNIIEKRSLIENMFQDKLDLELNKIVKDHFRTNIIDIDYNLNTDKKSIGYILFEKNTTKGIKRVEKDGPIFFIKKGNKYDISSGIEKNKTLANLKKIKTDVKYGNYYIYNNKNIQNESTLKVNVLIENKMMKKMCHTIKSQLTQTNFQIHFPEIYEKYENLFENHKDLCDLIEILLRIESLKSPKYHYNYDEFMLNNLI